MANKKTLIILGGMLAIMPLSAYAFLLDPLDENFFNAASGVKVPSGAETSNSQIVNEINISARTGNNVVSPGGAGSSGEVKEGKKEASVKVKSVINGKEIDSIDIKSSSGDVKVESRIEADKEKARVERKTEIDSAEKTENYEVDLKKSETDKVNSTNSPNGAVIKMENSEKPNEEKATNNDNKKAEKNLNFLRIWWSGFAENLKNLFRNLFSIF